MTSALTPHTCPICSCPVPLYSNPMVATEPDEVEPQARVRWAAFLAERCPNGPHDVPALGEATTAEPDQA